MPSIDPAGSSSAASGSSGNSAASATAKLEQVLKEAQADQAKVQAMYAKENTALSINKKQVS